MDNKNIKRDHSPPSRESGDGKLSGKVALITAGDNCVGRAVAELFAREGAGLTISCEEQDQEADKTLRIVEKHTKRCLLLPGDPSDTGFCIQAVERTLEEHGGLDILVNNSAAEPLKPAKEPPEPFCRNLLSTIFMTQSALFYLEEGGVILNTIPYEPQDSMHDIADYLAARIALVNFTRTLARELEPKKIRVNAVAPEAALKQAEPGRKAPARRRPQPEDIAPSYLFLASNDSSFMTGQILYPGSAPQPY